MAQMATAVAKRGQNSLRDEHFSLAHRAVVHAQRAVSEPSSGAHCATLRVRIAAQLVAISETSDLLIRESNTVPRHAVVCRDPDPVQSHLCATLSDAVRRRAPGCWEAHVRSTAAVWEVKLGLSLGI
jgi:hypothetical protein